MKITARLLHPDVQRHPTQYNYAAAQPEKHGMKESWIQANEDLRGNQPLSACAHSPREMSAHKVLITAVLELERKDALAFATSC